MNVIQYEHHGKKVWVQEHLKGKHREHCLCWQCGNFKPQDREANCPIANELFALCVKHNLTTPVFECPVFVPKEQHENISDTPAVVPNLQRGKIRPKTLRS